MCRRYTIRLHSTACQTWQCLHIYGDVFWACCWGFQAQCFGNGLFLLWRVKICIDLGPLERVIWIYGHTQKWLFLYTDNMKSHQQREEQKSYQWKICIPHKKMKLMPCMWGFYCFKDFHHSYRGVQVMFMYSVQTTIIGSWFLLLILNINPFRSYIGSHTTVWLSSSAPMSEDVWHSFCCICLPAVGACPTLFLM
jgi:hypothetical protein